jgi:hypothetical protein
MNGMKSAVTIILLLFIVHSLRYVYKEFLNIEHFEVDDLDMKLEKSLETTFEKFSLMNQKNKQESMSCMHKK